MPDDIPWRKPDPQTAWDILSGFICAAVHKDDAPYQVREIWEFMLGLESRYIDTESPE